MKDKFFLDTNIFVYTFDEDKRKNRVARDLVGVALGDHYGVISSQVVQEFLNVALRKFEKPLTFDDAKLYLDKVLAPLCEIYPTLDLYSEALSLHKKTGYSFYDSLIVTAALQADCTVLYSEDLQHGRSLQGLRIENPFR